jgi:glycosyltransferase involved in cell wall biosynthesis
MSRILAVIPAHNEATSIGVVLRELRDAAPHVERLVVSDGSIDGTPEVVRSLGERQLELVCNVGYGRAVQAGLQYAIRRGYDTVVTIDSDGQHDPRDVPRLLHALAAADADVAIGSRFVERKAYRGSLGRRLGQAAFSLLTRVLLGRRVYDTTSGFKAMRRSACHALLEGRFLDFHTEALIRLGLLGFRMVEVPVTMRSRTAGTSMYTVASAILYPVKTLLLVATGIIDAKLRGKTK